MDTRSAAVRPWNACWICGSTNLSIRRLKVPTRSFDATANIVEKTIDACATCGYERDISIRSLSDALAIQGRFSTETPRVPRPTEAFWPRRPSLVGATIRKLCPNLRTALDVGCNAGLNLFALGPAIHKFGIEMSPTLADVATKFSGASVFQTPIEEFDWKGEPFDVVMSFAVIEHVYDPKAFVGRLLTFLRTGGVLILMTGDRESYTARKLGDAWPLYISSDHVSFFSAKSVRNLLCRFDCEILREEWRFMYFHNGLGNVFSRLAMKTFEIGGLVRWPWHDLYYIYGRKR